MAKRRCQRNRTFQWGAVWPPGLLALITPGLQGDSEGFCTTSNIHVHYFKFCQSAALTNLRLARMFSLARLLELYLSHQRSVVKPSFAYKEQISILPSGVLPSCTGSPLPNLWHVACWVLQRPKTYPIHDLPRSSLILMLSWCQSPTLKAERIVFTHFKFQVPVGRIR